MQYADDIIIEILYRLPSECAYLDYKEIPYLKDHYHDLIKDVIAMLNSEEGIGYSKAIIFGVSDDIPHHLRGIDSFLGNTVEKFDDASYQTVFDRITPRPHITVGTVMYQGRTFGYVFMDADMNREWVYEVKETYIAKSSPNKPGVFIGQAFTRRGSKNYVMMQQDRDHLKNIFGAPLFTSGWQNSHPTSTSEMDPILIAAIIGCWNENKQSDRSLIEILSGMPYSNWIQSLRKLYENKNPSIAFSDNVWCAKNPEVIFDELGIQLYDSHIAKITMLIERAFSDYDTKYDLKPVDRFAASAYHKSAQYSGSIRRGLSRFLAIAGNFSERFPSCSSWKLKKLIDDMIKEVIESPDWRVIATMEGNFQLLAEASPLCFTKSVQAAITAVDSGLCVYLSEFESLFGTQFYGCWLIYALTLIACRQEFFSSACFAAFCVLKKRPEHLENLTSVFLPWAPKTEAPLSQRISIVKLFFEEDDNLAWKFLCTLLPEQTTACGAFERPKYLACKIKEQTSTLDAYWEESDAYLELAIEKGANHKERLLTLQEFLDKVPEDIFYKILAEIEAVCSNCTDEDKYIFWNKLSDLRCKHKQFPDADWVMPEKALTAIELAIEKIAPNDRRIKIRRLFQDRTYDILPEKYNSYVERETALSTLRLEELNWCYQTYGMEALIACIESFDSVRSVGSLLAKTNFTDECDSNIHVWLASDQEKRKALAKEYLQVRFQAGGVPWLKTQLEGRSEEATAVFLSSIPLMQETMYLAEQLLTDQLEKYWKQVPMWGLEDDTKADYIIQKLLQYERPSDALELISIMHHAGHFLSGDVIFETLKSLAEQQSDIVQHNAYTAVSLIEWLQENWDDERVILLEWWYFKLFQSYGSRGPKRMYMTLANNSDFFIEVLCHAFRGRHEPKTEISDEVSRMGEHSFDVLFHWNITPGTNQDGVIDADKLHKWFSAVKTASQEKDRYAIAMQLIGAAFFYSPPDPDGLFIHHAVAELLHREDDNLREGYYSEAIKSRGAHFVDPSGAPEFALEKRYNEYAVQIDALGLFRFAEKLRLLAKFYHSEAIQNIEDNRKLQELQDAD
ncbi:MAG: ATP-binding protein [Ruminococcus flavefaciens]|nr:ATP-binding protein [Ruminococcus flavefaciens]